MQSECRVNVKNRAGLTPMDIAKQEGYNDMIAQLSGLGNCNLHSNEDCDCEELRKILFHNNEMKADDLKKLKWKGADGAIIATKLEEKIRRTSETTALQLEHTWQEKMQLARAEVLAHCESRIVEIERECKMKVARIERQCSQRMQAARDILGGDDTPLRPPSAPSAAPSESRRSVELPDLRARSL